MKGSYLLLILAVSLSCSRQDLELLGGKLRNDTIRGGASDGTDGARGLEYAAFSYDAGFDWPAAAPGSEVPFELIRYRSDAELFRLQGGRDNCIDPDPDHHHIVYGKLFTQYADAVSLSVAVDGKRLFDSDRPEILAGVMVDGEDIYSLCVSRPKGFTLRKNEAILLRRSEGVVFGSLSDPSYSPGGALYMDGGDMVFCYCVEEMQSRRIYCVRNGKENLLKLEADAIAVLDGKMKGGNALILPSYYKGCRLMDGRIWTGGKQVTFSAYVEGIGSVVCGERYGQEAKILSPSRGKILHCGEVDYVLLDNGSGLVTLTTGERGGSRIYMDSYLLSDACVAIGGEDVALAMSACRKDEAPFVSGGGKSLSVPVNGYICCLALPPP